MLFCSYVFILAFLPLTVLFYFVLSRYNHNVGKMWLLIASLFFYGYFNPSYLWILCGSLFFNYFWGELLFRKQSNILLVLGIIGNLLLLGYCKYYDFFVENINFIFNAGWNLKHIVLPLGISFFTFQQISYLVDAKNHTLPCRYSFFAYSLFVTFFPQLVAGPIVLPGEMMPQFDKPENRYPDSRNISAGLFVFSLGLAKKMLLADNFAIIADQCFAMSNPSFMDSLYGIFAYTFQIYFDFSGYCDMAIGIGLLFNIKLPVNFFAPYKSGNIQDFWRNWHITLGRFLFEFVYKPLGGSKKGNVRTYINLLITFLVSGLWHGASWMFVIWGGLHGLAMIIHRFWRKHSKIQLPRFAGGFLTFLFVAFAWGFFRAENSAVAKRIFSGLLNFDNAAFCSFIQDVSTNNVLLVLISAFIVFFLPPANTFTEKFRPNLLFLLTNIVLLLACIFELNKTSPFIYFNF